MEKVLTNELSRFLIILGIGVIGLSVLMVKMISRLAGSFTPYKRTTIYYVLVSIILFALIGFIAHPTLFSEPLSLFIFYQAYFLLFGIVHFYCMHQYLNWSGTEKSFWTELLFSVVVGMFGCIAFVLVYQLVNKNGLELIMASSILFLIVPLFVYHTFRKAISIPPKIIRQWYYPVHEEIGEPDENKLKNLLVISFEFQKQTNDPNFTNFSARAPTDMEFGQLFYYFINDYNERHPNAKIQYVSVSGDPHGWIFYKKSKWYNIITRYIDPEKTIFNNNIRENDVIVCNRFPD
jgi:hypothetical protein